MEKLEKKNSIPQEHRHINSQQNIHNRTQEYMEGRINCEQMEFIP